MEVSPSPPVPAHPLRRGGKVLVVNGDLHGRSFYNTNGEKIQPGQMCWVWPAHANALAERNRMWRRVDV